jgi:threonylcarbamoyladenosine tRNA methylthiotransferase MtaB
MARLLLPRRGRYNCGMNERRTCRLVTLGCKVNQYETQHVKEALEAHGYREADQGKPADLCVVNTCTVTHEADAKGRQLIRRLHLENPGAGIVVMGCFATRDPAAVARLPGVSHVIPDKTKLAEELRRYGVRQMPRGITRFDGHQRAFVKVQDGCLLKCSYCIIPNVRPTLRSRDPEAIEEEVRRLVKGGRQEIVLTGIHLGHYGIDLSRGRPKSHWCRLWHLVERLDRLPGDFRIRLSSLEAAEVRDPLVEVLARARRVVPHLHLCLQSGSDRILRLMKRRYTAAGFLERCRRLRQVLNQPAFSTDVIIGFPGETEADFGATCDVLRKGGFSKVHLFTYSPRQGTAAVELREALAPAVVARRRERLRELERELAGAYYHTLLDRQLDVLVEGEDADRPGFVRGTSCRYATVIFPAVAPALIGRRVRVRAEYLQDGVIVASPDDSLPAFPDDSASPTRNRRLALPLTS